MSLFVKGAKLPKIEGDKSIKAEIRCVGGKWEFGIMTGGYYCSQEWTFYPLSELPPHGRLIDADAPIEVWEVRLSDGDSCSFRNIETTVSKFLRSHLMGEVPPTIIPKEG